jgi:hypothetical protein
MPNGGTIVFTATASCASPLFRFYVTDPNGARALVQNWANSNKYSWSTTPQQALGVYEIKVDARNASDANVEQSVTVSYALGSAPGATNVCANLAMFTYPTPPQLPGTTVAFRAQVTSCPAPLYQFWLTDTIGVGLLMQGWSTLANYSWPTNLGSSPGDYLMRVDVRNSSDAYADQSLIVRYTLGNAHPGAKCTNLAVAPNPISPQPRGTQVDINATVRSCGSPVYRFWIVDVGDQLVQDWSPSPKFAWDTGTVGSAGSFSFRVEATDSSDANIDQSVNVQYTLT